MSATNGSSSRSASTRLGTVQIETCSATTRGEETGQTIEHKSHVAPTLQPHMRPPDGHRRTNGFTPRTVSKLLLLRCSVNSKYKSFCMLIWSSRDTFTINFYKKYIVSNKDNYTF